MKLTARKTSLLTLTAFTFMLCVPELYFLPAINFNAPYSIAITYTIVIAFLALSYFILNKAYYFFNRKDTRNDG